MNVDSILLLAKPGEIADYVMDLWSPGGLVEQNHRDGGLVHQIVQKFARLPRIFFDASDQRLEWTHFSPWWSAIQLADYENPTIRDLRYLHEIYHAATMPYARGMNGATMAARNAQNEREASTFSEMAIYLELPELRSQSFEHPIFMDRFLFTSSGDGKTPNERLFERWRHEPDVVFQELLYARLGVVLASDDEVDPNDPQIVWLRRYPEQGDIWNGVWAERHRQVDNAMVNLRDRCESMGRVEAAKRHLDWLMSPEISEGSDIPFRREAEAFRTTFDALIASYDRAMEVTDQKAVRHR
ncbi:hypothetical protein [Sphingomonas sp. 3-13AW]|uniref:hypothetical protein n=1 Tax=Sphingomonas sp. 3-13AW TaxID=3050450 RepID=UPI003BB606C1